MEQVINESLKNKKNFEKSSQKEEGRRGRDHNIFFTWPKHMLLFCFLFCFVLFCFSFLISAASAVLPSQQQSLGFDLGIKIDISIEDQFVSSEY